MVQLRGTAGLFSREESGLAGSKRQLTPAEEVDEVEEAESGAESAAAAAAAAGAEPPAAEGSSWPFTSPAKIPLLCQPFSQFKLYNNQG